MKRLSFNKLGLYLMAGLAVTACSPVAPSVSKLTNAATNPTDSTSPSGNLTAPSAHSLHSKSADSKTEEAVSQTTEVTSQEEFENRLASVAHESKIIQIEDRFVLQDLVQKGLAAFESHEDVQGHEHRLFKKNLKIYFVLSTSLDKIGAHDLAELKASVKWHGPANKDKDGFWELRCDQLIDRKQKKQRDPVADVVAAESRENLRKHLVKIGLEFAVD